MPSFVMAESNGKEMEIVPSKLVPNENYIVKGPGPDIEVKKRKRNTKLNRDGKFHKLAHCTYHFFLFFAFPNEMFA